MPNDQDQHAAARAAGARAGQQLRADYGMAILGGGGSIPGWPTRQGPSRTGQAARAVGGRAVQATKAAAYDRLKRRNRTWLRVFLFGTGKPPAGASTARRTTKRGKGKSKGRGLTIRVVGAPSGAAAWTPEQRSRAARKAAAQRHRDSAGRFA